MKYLVTFVTVRGLYYISNNYDMVFSEEREHPIGSDCHHSLLEAMATYHKHDKQTRLDAKLKIVVVE